MDVKLLIWSLVCGLGISVLVTGNLYVLAVALLLIVIGEIYERR